MVVRWYPFSRNSRTQACKIRFSVCIPSLRTAKPPPPLSPKLVYKPILAEAYPLFKTRTVVILNKFRFSERIPRRKQRGEAAEGGQARTGRGMGAMGEAEGGVARTGRAREQRGEAPAASGRRTPSGTKQILRMKTPYGGFRSCGCPAMGRDAADVLWDARRAACARPWGGALFYRKYRTAERNSPISYVPGTFRYSPLPMRSEWPILPSTRPSGEVMPSMA